MENNDNDNAVACSALIRSGWATERDGPDYELRIADYPRVHDWWRDWLAQEMSKDYFGGMCKQIGELHAELEDIFAIYPRKRDVFKVFEKGKPKVVILAQDPYISEGQAMGLALSVPPGVTRPRSLLNLYKELARDPAFPDVTTEELPKHGDLTSWNDQSVMLLNTALTVRERESGSHLGLGWKTFTKHVIERINTECEGVVWMLWGNYAQTYAKHINARRHTVLKAGHPSPLNRRNPFVGCGHFSKCNESLIAAGHDPIDWASICKTMQLTKLVGE